MGFREAVTVCIQDYYTFSGRARRPEYWWFALFVIAVSFALSAIDAALFGADKLLGLEGLFALLTLLPHLAVAWRRIHDTGRPGWYNLLPLAPVVVTVPLFLVGIIDKSLLDPADVTIMFLFLLLVSSIVVLVWLALPTQRGENRFGPEPPR